MLLAEPASPRLSEVPRKPSLVGTAISPAACSQESSETFDSLSGQKESAARRNSTVLRFLSWNIDGLNSEHYLAERTASACAEIKKSDSDVVFLQEVVAENLDMLRKLLVENGLYRMSELLPEIYRAHYYNIILFKASKIENISTRYLVPTSQFPYAGMDKFGSDMGRHLLSISGESSNSSLLFQLNFS